MIFTPSGLGGDMVGNSTEPQPHFALHRAVGFGLIIASSLTSTNTGFSQQYTHGTHAAAIYDSQFKGKIFPSVKGGVPNNAVKVFNAAPQQYDFTLPAVLTQPMVNQQPGAIGSQFTWGTHNAIYDTQNLSFIVESSAPGVGSKPILPTIVPPQQYDFTLPPSIPFVPVPTGWISTQIGAGPQLVDLTIQADITPAQPKALLLANWNPTTILSRYQEDPTQLPAKIFSPPMVKAPFISPRSFFAGPIDPTQIQPDISPSVPTPPKPAKYVQPVLLTVQEQTYQNIPYIPFSYPVNGPFIPPPPPGFRVQAVTAGWYLGVFRTPGDVFDLVTGNDFSDSTVNYQVNSNSIGYGWMTKVPATTPLFNWLETNNAPYLPPTDPNRRFVY